MWEHLAEWWDSVELWLTQLWFPVQVTLVMAVLLPLCWGAAQVLDRGVDGVLGQLSRLGRRQDRR